MLAPFPLPGRRRLALTAAGAGAVAAVAGVTLSGGGFALAFSQGFAGASHADQRWLALAFAGFAGSMAATAGGWRSTLAECGGRLGAADACARYGVGSLLNIVLPGRVGEVVRVRLFSKALPSGTNAATATTIGVLGAVTVGDTIAQSGVVGAAVGIAPLPPWSFALLAGAVAFGAAAGYVAVRRFGAGRLAPLLDASRSLARHPARALRVFGWLVAATAARLLAAVAVAVSLGLPSPLEAGVIMCGVVIVATAFPVTPGSLGVTSGAIVLALHSGGAPLASAMAAGIVFHAVELLAGLVFGAAATLALLPRRRRIRHGRLGLAAGAG